MLTIDGSHGEGGGQILRSSLALSIVTGTPFRIEKIRAGRAKPGLMRQHLTAVQAAAAVCGATVEGERIGSTALTFKSGKVAGGEFHFRIGTAGSTTLVLQTVLLPLLLADRASRVTLEGGTHNPHAPPFDFLAKAYLPLANRMGPSVRAALERPGFYPAGGGKIVIDIDPAAKLQGIDLLERGEQRGRLARVLISNLGRHVAERELRVIQRKLNWEPSLFAIEELRDAHGPGNVVTIEVEYEHVTEVFTSFGEPQRPAEAVANDAVQQYQRYIKAAAPAGEFLTDQLMLPLAVARAGSFASTGLSPHARTHIGLIREFLGERIRQEQRLHGEVTLYF